MEDLVGRVEELLEEVRPMGVAVDREAPFYFNKSSLAYGPSGATVPYPASTANYHYEMELVVAIGTGVFAKGAWRASSRCGVPS